MSLGSFRIGAPILLEPNKTVWPHGNEGHPRGLRNRVLSPQPQTQDPYTCNTVKRQSAYVFPVQYIKRKTMLLSVLNTVAQFRLCAT